MCYAYLIGSSVARGLGSQDTGDCSHSKGEKGVGWAQRVVQAVSAVYGISMEQYTFSGTNTGLWLDPDQDVTDRPVGGTWNAVQRKTVNDFYANLTDSSTPGLFVLIGLSLANEGMSYATDELDPAYNAEVGTASQVVDVYNAGIQGLVSMISSRGMPTIVAGPYPGKFSSTQTNGTWLVNDRMSSGTTSPSVSTSQGTFISFLRGGWPTHRCEADLRAGTVEVTNAECGRLQPKYSRFKQTAGGLRSDSHPNVYGHLAMYRNIDLSVFEAFSIKGGCTTTASPYVYQMVGVGIGECTLPVGPVVFKTHSGDRLASDSAFSARQDVCEKLCSATPLCYGYDFMTNASLGRQLRQCGNAACDSHSCDSSGGTTGTDDEPPMERRCRLVVSTDAYLEANPLDRSESADAYAAEYVCYRRGPAEPPRPPRPPSPQSSPPPPSPASPVPSPPPPAPSPPPRAPPPRAPSSPPCPSVQPSPPFVPALPSTPPAPSSPPSRPPPSPSPPSPSPPPPYPVPPPSLPLTPQPPLPSSPNLWWRQPSQPPPPPPPLNPALESASGEDFARIVAPPAQPAPIVAVVVTMTASGSVSDHSDTASLRTLIANLAGVDASRVTVRVAAASVLITATIAVPVSTVAAVTISLSNSLFSISAASTALGITVQTVPSVLVAAPPPPPPPIPEPALNKQSDEINTIFILLIVFALAIVALVVIVAGKHYWQGTELPRTRWQGNTTGNSVLRTMPRLELKGPHKVPKVPSTKAVSAAAAGAGHIPTVGCSPKTEPAQ